MWFLPPIHAVVIPGAWVMALASSTMGAVICVAGVLAFRSFQTTVNPLTPEATTTLVVRGVYRFTRNPMYLGFTLLLLAFAVWLGKMSALALVPLFMAYLQHFQIKPEEEALRARFGDLFDTYCQQVRRWL